MTDTLVGVLIGLAIGIPVGAVLAVATLAAAARLRRRGSPHVVSADGAAVARAKVPVSERAVAVLNPDDPARRRVVESQH